MAWKLLKDKPQTALPPGEEAAAEATPQDTEPVDEHTSPLPSEDQSAQEHAFVVVEEEPQFAPFDFSATAFQTDPVPEAHTLDDTLTVPSPPDAPDIAFEPFRTQEPRLTEAPFAPPSLAPITEAEITAPGIMPGQVPVFEPSPVTPPPTFATEAAPVRAAEEPNAEREALASNLILPENEPGVPRVAPFIVDIPPAEEAIRTSATLVLHIGNLSASLPITKDVTVIGRPDSEVQSYPDLEIELDDAISRRHAEVRRREDGYFLVDTMSTNGTLLNGERLDAYKEYPLAHGDRIHLGDRTEILFE